MPTLLVHAASITTEKKAMYRSIQLKNWKLRLRPILSHLVDAAVANLGSAIKEINEGKRLGNWFLVLALLFLLFETLLIRFCDDHSLQKRQDWQPEIRFTEKHKTYDADGKDLSDRRFHHLGCRDFRTGLSACLHRLGRLMASFSDPGFEHKETVQTGLMPQPQEDSPK